MDQHQGPIRRKDTVIVEYWRDGQPVMQDEIPMRSRVEILGPMPRLSPYVWPNALFGKWIGDTVKACFGKDGLIDLKILHIYRYEEPTLAYD